MAKNSSANTGDMALDRWSAVRDRADNQLRRVGMTQWNYGEEDRKQKLNDFSGYLNSGNYSLDNNKKYRDMATQAVADLDAEMKRYGTSSNEYKTLKGYKTYYENALPTFDRLDVGANVQDYLSYDQDKGFTNWHSQDDYNTQKSYLDQQRQAVQTELDGIEDKTSVDYQNLKSWQDQLDMYANALEERNNWDKQFEDVNDYTAYERAGDYKNSIQAKQTLKDAQDQLKETEARLKAMQMKFAAVTDLSTLDGADAQEYQDFINLQQDYKQLQENVTNAAAEVAGLEKWQKNTATYNLLSQYGEDADYEQVLNDLRAAREKAQEGTEDWAKIDLQIRAIAGENEDGLNENGQYDDSTLLGRSIMRDFDVDAAQKRLDEIDQELKDLGVSTSRFWGGVTNADNAFGVDAAGMVYTDENAVGESDPRVMALRQEKTELTRKMNSAEKFQEKDAAETAFKNLSDEDHAALQEEGLKHISQKGNNFYRDGGYDPTQSSGMLENFQYLDDELGGDIRDMLIEAVGAEALGRDIGYTVDDIMRLYQGDINHIAGKKEADKISAMDSDFARWNRQVLGVGTQAGLNQFVTGIRQAFSDDYIEPNKTSYKAQYTREDLKRYGDENFINGSNVSQVLFDTTQTTANMLPMIAASALLTKAGAAPVVGELVGAGLMSLSSGGNTYQQALAEGWDKTDAKAYSTILGAAEGAMQYLIGGISGLGGVTEDSILKAAQGINNAAVRFATETGVHILSETTEELAQNRLQRYLEYNLFDKGDADWMSWDDDDWYTVIVTALSTGAMEGLPGGINAVKTSRLGNQLAGNVIPGKAALKSSQANNELITEVGKAMQGNEALHETLTTIGLNLMEEGSEAYDLAERMQSGKAAKSAWNYGTLYSEILSEYQARNGKNGTADAMAAVIGGAIKYHELKRAEDTVSQAEAQAAQVRRENPGAEVLEANASALSTMGVGNAAQATEYGALANKVLSGTSLSDAEMQKLLGDSTAAKATRVLLSRQSSNPEALRELNLSLTRGNTEAAKAAINSQIEEARAAKQLQRQANIEAVAQAAAEAADQSAVSAAAANAERSPAAVAQGQERVVASTVKAVQKADTELEAATRRLEQLKKMSFKELANSKLLGEGGAEILVNAATDQDMRQQMATLQNRAEKLSAVRFPSQAQRTELADIREQQAALKEQIVANAESVRSQLEARASANASRGSANAAPAADTAAAPAEAAQITSADTIIVPGTGARMSREGFVQDYMAQNPGVTLEQANERFDQYAEQTGAVTKGNAENGQTADQDQERNDVGERGDRTEDQGRSDQSEQAAERSGADEFEELRTDGSRPEDAPAARVTKGASRVTDDNIEVISDDYTDIPELTASLKRSGFKKITFILDGDLVNDLGDSVAAVYNNGELFLRLDYPQPGYDYVGTAEHERLHLKLELMRAKFGDEDGKAFVSTTLQSLLGREAFTKAFDAYAKVYGPVYLASGLSVDEVAHMICEEMLCDMVGGINNFGTDLGDYLEDAEGILEASKFNVVMQNLVDNPSGDPGMVIMEEIDKNALPYGIPADTLISSENVDNPSTQPADASQVSKYAFFGLAEALGFKVDQTGSKNKVYYLNDEDAKLGRNGFTQITVDIIKQSPIGDLIRYSVDKGDITADEAEQQYNLFASIASITDQTHDFYQAMQFMGSTIFTAMKANSDKQYGTTYDFPSICTKTQAVINEMGAQMVAKGRSLTEDEIIEAYNNVFNDGNPVPCPECYVFSRWVGIGGLLDNIRSYQDRFGKMTVEEVITAYDEANKEVLAFAEENGPSKGRAKGSLASKLDKQFKSLEESIQTKENQGEAVAEKDYETRDKLAARMATIRSLTWIDDVYFGGKAHKASNVNPNFAVPLEVLYDLNEGETFARDYKEAWAFRTTQGAGYGKAITPYAEAILGEGMLVTTNTTKSIKAKANGNLNNPYQTERGKITENSARGKNLKAARQKELNQLFIGGQRLQSTSDARFDNAVDYLLSALELQAMHSGAQVYTKVPGAVAFFNACKYCTNMSMMPKGGGLDANGTPVDTNVGGMDLTTMMMLRKRFEYAGSITIGVNDDHIRALMAQEFRDFIIPYHASGGKMTLIESFRQTQDPDLKGTTIRSSDYTKTQSDKILNDDVLRDSLGKSEKEIEDIHKFRETRLWILTGGKSGAYHSEILNPYEDGITEAQSNARRVLQGVYASMQEGGKWNGVKLAKGKVEHQIFPNEFWDVSSTYENSSVNTQRYLDYCDALGFLHRFSGKTVTYNRKTGKSEIVPVTGYDQNGNKIPLTDLAYKNGTDGEIEPFFWKTLTDRRMYGNNGQYLEQPNVDLTNLKAETVTTFAAPMGERRYNHRVSMTNAAARAANVSRNSIQSLPDGRKYVKLDGNIFLNEDGSEMSPSQAYNRLVGTSITTEDGDTITFVNRLDGVRVRDELFRKRPGYSEGVDPDAIGQEVNRNIVEAIQASSATERNQAQTHPKPSVSDFDVRDVLVADDNAAYNIKFSIANLNDGTKVAYAKKYISAEPDVFEEIKKAETMAKVPKSRLETETGRKHPDSQSGAEATELQPVDSITPSASEVKKEIEPIEEVPAEAVTEEVSEGGRPIPRYSMRETDPETLKFLNDQLEKGEVVRAYKTFLELTDENGNVQLYPPMATVQTGEDGKRKMANAMAVGAWEKSVGNPNSKNIFYDKKKDAWYYNLVKDNGGSVPAAYDPYQHSSNVVLNDQFESAYQRPNLATYEVVIPQSELTSGYHYEATRDDGQVVRAALPVGEHPWKKGIVAGKLKNTDRTVYMTRWLMPVRKVENSEVAQMYKEILDREETPVAIPFNVVPPGLQEALERAGVPIDYEGSGQYKSWGKRYGTDRFPAGKPIVGTQSRLSIQNDGTENTNPYPENTLQHDMLEAARNGTLSEWVTEQMNAHEDALENAKIRPPVIPSKGFVPKVTAQEKAALENRRKGLIQAKGAMKPSEKSNGFAMPKKDEAGNWFHRFLQNVGSAKELKVAQDQVEKFAFTDVAGTYTPDSNKADLNWAKNVISEDGLDSAVKQFNREAMKMEMPSNVTKSLALGQQLLIETSRQGDMQKFLDVLSSLTLLSSQAGKSLQAFRMLKQSGPIGELYYVQKAVGQLNDRNADKITAGRMSEITVPEDLANAVLMASTQEAQDKAMDELIAGIAAQVPVTLMDKWNAWRYMAMLGNARTHVRNIIGNAVFVPLRFAKDLMAAGGEFLATKTGLMEEQDRRKAISVSRELRDFAKQDALAMQKELQGSGKYNPAREILDARKILPGFLETISRKNGELLEYEDWLFLSPAYQGALSQALAHTGYSLSEMLDGSNKDAVRALNNARRIAIEEAQKATYRDFNAAASMLNRIKRMESGKTSDKVIGVLLEGILPFTKTPINILRRGVEYSPIGIASSIFEAAAGVKNGNLDVAQFIDHLSAGLSGTAVAVLGYLLASLGYIRNKKDDKEEEFDKLQGYQDYSIQIGKVSATIDWAAPTALPLFTGAAAYDMIQRDEGLEWKDAWDAMMMIAEPMMSLSMLDGLNSTLSAASYADDSQKLATVASSAFTSYLGQAFPTLLGQVARSIDGTRRSTYVDKNSPVPTAIQRFVQSSVQNKIPVWEEQKIPYIDQWGREDTVSSKFLGAMENFLSPSYVNIVHTTDVDEALRDLYDTTKDSGVLPSTVAKYFSVAGERKDLTAGEYVSYAKDVGSTKYQLLTSLFADPRYMSLTDDQKAEAVSVIYKYATAAGKYHVDQNYDLHAQGKWIEEAEAAATDVQRFNRIWEYLEEHFKK